MSKEPAIMDDEGYNVKTWGYDEYQYFPFSNSPHSTFKVKTAQDAQVALTTDLQDGGPMYEIIIGRAKNTKSAIRKNREDKVETTTTNILNENEYTTFWITLKHNVISVGREGEAQPFISWADSKLFRIFFIGVCTRNYAHGYWKIDYVKTTGYESDPYRFFPVGNGIFTFKVKAAHDAQIVLTTTPEKSDTMVEVTIGCTDNTESMIKKYEGVENDKMIVKSHSILSDLEFRCFRIEWSISGFRVFYDHRIEPLLIPIYPDPDMNPIFYIGVRTDQGAAGTWIFDAHRAYNQSVPSVRPCTWINASNGHIPFGAVRGGQDVTEEPTFVARIKDAGATLVGKLIPSKEAVFAGKDGKEQSSNNYQVLVRRQFDNWVLTKEAEVPPTAVICGRTTGGEPLYIGLVHKGGYKSLGWVRKSTGLCYFTYGDKYLTSPDYEILVN